MLESREPAGIGFGGYGGCIPLVQGVYTDSLANL